MNRILHNYWYLSLLTILLHLVGLLALRWQILYMFSPTNTLAPTLALHSSYVWLALIGILGTLTALAGIYQLLRRARWFVAIALVAFPCLPSLFLSMLYLYGLLLFEGAV